MRAALLGLLLYLIAPAWPAPRPKLPPSARVAFSLDRCDICGGPATFAVDAGPGNRIARCEQHMPGGPADPTPSRLPQPRAESVAGSRLTLPAASGRVNPEWEMAGGYVSRSGKWVAPYHRTRRNSATRDNYSHRGNVNPWTGRRGSKR